MMLAWIWLCLVLVSFSHTLDCDPSWFGRDCQYKSRCHHSDCVINWVCPRDSTCDSGWFGPGCQFVNLVVSSKSVTANPDTNLKPLTDGNDQTCLMNPSNQDLIVTWDQEYVISWMRLYLSQTGAPAPDVVDVFNITSSGLTRKRYVPTWRSVRVTDKVLDIQFVHSFIAAQVNISGHGVGHLCSLYISGGRNVALRQPTSQSSNRTYEEVDLVSSLAVDGDKNGFLQGKKKSCSSTKSGDKSPTWELEFPSPKVIYQIVIHNRDVKGLLYRLQGFTLTLFAVGGTTLEVIQDTQDTPLETYFIRPASPSTPVARVRIQAASHLNAKNVSEAVLELCEVEIFGDSVCPPKTVGSECEHVCNCTVRDEDCSVHTGRCPSDCTGTVCIHTCTEDFPVSTEDTESVLMLALYVGVSLAVTCIIIIIVIVVLSLCRRKMRRTPPQNYDVVDSSAQYSHQYNVLSRTEASNGEAKHPQTETRVASHSSQVYHEVDDHEYVELTDTQALSSQLYSN